MSGFNPRWIIGRTIVGVELHTFNGREAGYEAAHRPEITLDNGAKLFFLGEETDYGEYGVTLIYRKPER